VLDEGPPLWSSGQSFWLQIQRSQVRSPALPFLSSSGSGTGSTQPREVNWGATWIKKGAAPGLETAVGTRCADHVTPLYPQKLALTTPTGGGRSVGIVRVRTKATEFSLVLDEEVLDWWQHIAPSGCWSSAVEWILLRWDANLTFRLKCYDMTLVIFHSHLPLTVLFIINLFEWQLKLIQWNHCQLSLKTALNVDYL